MRELAQIRRKVRKQYMWGSASRLSCLKMRLLKSESYDTYRFLLHLRTYEYLIRQKTTPLTTLRRVWNLRQYQKYAGKCGFVIGDGVLGEDVVIYHRGNIIINPAARVGAGCIFHGSCCIGNSHPGSKCPVLGENVDIGYGAVIIGDIYIADDITIGANAVVTKSFYEPGITIAGSPARKIRDRKTEA